METPWQWMRAWLHRIAAGQDRFARRALEPGAAPLPDAGGRRADVVPPKGLDDVTADCVQYGHGRRPSALPLARVAPTAGDGDTFVWISLPQPSAADIGAVAQVLRLPALAVEDAVKAHQRPKLEVYDDIVFVVLKPVTYVDHDEVVDVSEVAVFLGPGFAVTVPHGGMDVLDRVRRDLDAGDPELLRCGSSAVLYRAADLVVDGYESAIESINEDVDAIESLVFDSTGSDGHTERIYKLKREVAEFRRAVQPLAAPLQQLAAGTVPGVGDAVMPYFRDVHDHVLRAADAIDGHDRLLTDVLQSDLARVTARQSEIALRQNETAVRQNQDMRKISAWAAIALVPTAIAGIYGMNFDFMPELRWRYGYFVVVGVIVTVCVVLHRLFRRNGWL